jgi:hypothetical protein
MLLKIQHSCYLGGEPLGERFIWWNFVSSRKERIEQAKEDWKQGRIQLPPSDDKEFIPLPDDKTKPAGKCANSGAAFIGNDVLKSDSIIEEIIPPF